MIDQIKKKVGLGYGLIKNLTLFKRVYLENLLSPLLTIDISPS
jgi:hypothetical protein